MKRQFWLISTVGLLSLLAVVIFFYNDRNEVFRLSADEAATLLESRPTVCNTPTTCSLQAGDILVRRHITRKTRPAALYYQAHFTHAAFMISNTLLVESSGRERDSKDEVRILSLAGSDWGTENMEDVVVFRPTYYTDSLSRITEHLKSSASNPLLRFGFPKKGPGYETCVSLILTPLTKEGIIPKQQLEDKVSPDRLVQLLATHTNVVLHLKNRPLK